MDRQYKLSNVTKDYLSIFYYILDEMIKGMTGAELTDSISHNFIVQMIPHHKAAIEMSENILKYTTNIPLQNIATQIISEQTKSIENMEKILCSCSCLNNSPRDLSMYQRRMNQIMKTMFCEMENAPDTNNINADFIREMIPHHRGAIEMSKNALQYDICNELKPIIYAIIVSQQRGIAQMQQLLRCMGN
ncbi:MAG: DUF305 domain-containing protein [Clostridia bacterium]|nr:DUF305 domain-containing protein [Clostridia bacterium]